MNRDNQSPNKDAAGQFRQLFRPASPRKGHMQAKETLLKELEARDPTSISVTFDNLPLLPADISRLAASIPHHPSLKILRLQGCNISHTDIGKLCEASSESETLEQVIIDIFFDYPEELLNSIRAMHAHLADNAARNANNQSPYRRSSDLGFK